MYTGVEQGKEALQLAAKAGASAVLHPLQAAAGAAHAAAMVQDEPRLQVEYWIVLSAAFCHARYTVLPAAAKAGACFVLLLKYCWEAQVAPLSVDVVNQILAVGVSFPIHAT
jgi:hypothetical protein